MLNMHPKSPLKNIIPIVISGLYALNEHKSATKLAGLYAITPDGWEVDTLFAACEQACLGGIAALQLRDKLKTHVELSPMALALRALCARHGVLFIINDNVQLAIDCGADGVHLGREDGGIAQARAAFAAVGKANAIIGATCYNDIALAEAATAQGADYLAFGAMYPSKTKPLAHHKHAAPLALFGLAKHLGVPLQLPTVAIGGITLANAGAVYAAGADACAVVGDIFNRPLNQIAAHCRQYKDISQAK